MANAFMLKPLPIAAATTPIGSAAGYTPINVANDFAGVIWRSQTGVSAQIIIDLGQDTPIDAVMMFGFGGQITNLAAAAYIHIATSAQGPTFTGSNVTTGLGTGNYAKDGVAYPPVPGSILSSGAGVFVWQRSASDPSPAAVRYVLFSVLGMNAGDWITIARAVIGRRFQPERNFNAIALGVRDLGSLDFSARAVLMRRRSKKLRTLSVTFSSQHKDEVVASSRPLLEYMGNTEMAAVCSDPADDADRQNRCYFGPLVGDLSLAWRRADCWETKLNLVSIF